MKNYYQQLRNMGMTATQAFAAQAFASAYERYNGVVAPESYLRDVCYVVRRATHQGLRDLIRIAKGANGKTVQTH